MVKYKRCKKRVKGLYVDYTVVYLVPITEESKDTISPENK